MKVIQILPELNSGGVERGTLEVGKFLVEQGHESIVISNGGRQVEQLEAEGSRHITLPVHKKRLSSLKQVKEIRRLFETEKPDIIHLRSRLPAWLAYLAWRKMDPQTRPRLITTVHGFYSVNAYSAVMTKGEQVICVSNSVKDYVLKNYPKVVAEKLTVIHRGVAPEEFPLGYQPPADWLSKWQSEYPQLQDKYVVTLPGRITRWKGPLDFIQVIAGLKAKGIPVHGLLVGEPHPKKLDFLEEVKQAIQSAGLTSDITLVGHRSDLREVMAISDVIISCSTDPEAFGRVTLEALSIGKPVAGYDHGGVHEQLDALLPEGKISVGDVNVMMNILSLWHREPSLPLNDNHFTLQRMLESTLQVYESGREDKAISSKKLIY
ncbi:MAG: glycosyltransferase family 4 protein [Opitutales bacterium]|jgi:glycosyltransferase involved in cell wall biosynthesis|nr:glycosyltransferase family 4 protein [Opitutales bacterium]MDP4644009.1 glycosyltransferase family 4 protein [Opitutales bacterium]MDP4777035.1 glycosyltransferase family 4 protein [Opitutales bacterium]MDP4882669.1 glycosyltransferase family 4 protein [Opitutales bacterium]MDP5080966.1 glycosyltransferase family 4 protein [Opitutales bacterium]